MIAVRNSMDVMNSMVLLNRTGKDFESLLMALFVSYVFNQSENVTSILKLVENPIHEFFT